MYIQNPDASFQKLHFYVPYSIKEFFYTIADTVVEKSVIVLPFVVSFNTVKNATKNLDRIFPLSFLFFLLILMVVSTSLGY